MPAGPADRKESTDSNPELAGEVRGRGSSGDLPGRLNELPRGHPSSADYQSARAENPARDGDRQHRDSPGESGPRPDYAHAGHAAADDARAGYDRAGYDRAGYPRADSDRASEIRWSDDRRNHVLAGDETGGGHRHGTGRPGKTEFPAGWSDDRICDAILAVARNPDQAPQRQNWDDRWQVSGERDDVKIFAIIESDGRICTAWPDEGSPGVVKNAVKDS